MLADPDSGDIYLTVDQAVWRMQQDGSLTKLVDLGLFALSQFIASYPVR
jgi:hypothetical protein